MRSLMRSSIKRTSMVVVPVVTSSPAKGALCGSLGSFSARVSGSNGTKSKRRRRAVSSKASERSAVFIVPMMSTFAGTENGFPEYARTTSVGGGVPSSWSRLSASISVISSPNILLILPRLISSMTIAKRLSGVLRARRQSSLKAPSLILYATWLASASSSLASSAKTGRNPSTNSS
ncbi:hypothetical protein D3C84_826640 [compost metagenome]